MLPRGFTRQSIPDTLARVKENRRVQVSESVLVIHTGGTIGMVTTPDGDAPVVGALREHVDQLVVHARGELPRVEFLELDPLIDSANATPQTWSRLASVLFERRESHKGFVVLHGTDTLSYTASALSFLLPGFGRPIVVTGSQVPIAHIRSDGRQNLIGALQVAGEADIPEVCVLFGEVVLRGNRSTKVDASGFDAFESPRFPPLARLGINIAVEHSLVLCPDGPPRIMQCELAPVAAVRLFPGFSATTLANVCRPPLRGLIIEAYGAGNGPSNDEEFLAEIRKATASGIVVVVTTQCVRGSVQPGAYATGSALIRAGAVPAHDMTTEAALTKLAVLLGQGHDAQGAAALLVKDCAGEVSALT